MRVALVPRPVVATFTDNDFILSGDTTISTVPELSRGADLLQHVVHADTRLNLLSSSTHGQIHFELDQGATRGDEKYELEVDQKSVRVRARSSAGAINAVHTLRQLIVRSAHDPNAEWSFVGARVQDHPAHAWRGAHLDASRHFMPIDYLFRFVELIAMHKLNVLHLHLTDDQGWRVEIKRHPELTRTGAWRAGTVRGPRTPGWQDYPEHDEIEHGGYYSQNQLSELVVHAHKWGVQIVPEIEMPGHMQAAIAAYPHLGLADGPALPVATGWGISPHVLAVASEQSYQFCTEVLEEICQVFDSEYIHVGGDECPVQEWRADDRVPAVLEHANLAGVEQLQAWFMKKIGAFLSSRGRTMIGWDEILSGGAPDGSVVMSWRGYAGAIQGVLQGHDVIMAPHDLTYFDTAQSEELCEPPSNGGYLDTPMVYRFRAEPPGLSLLESRKVLGAQFQLWTEFMPDVATVEYMAFPRACAFAEAIWGTAGDAEFESKRLPAHLDRLRKLHVNLRHSEGRPV